MKLYKHAHIAACAALLLAALPASAQLPAKGAGLSGNYAGSYLCQDGEHGINVNITTLKEKEGGGFDASGVLAIFPVLAGKGGSSADAAGAFQVSGTIAADGAIKLNPGAWIKQPPSYGAAILDGKLQKRADGLWAITGKPVVPGMDGFCSNLVATKFLP